MAGTIAPIVWAQVSSLARLQADDLDPRFERCALCQRMVEGQDRFEHGHETRTDFTQSGRCFVGWLSPLGVPVHLGVAWSLLLGRWSNWSVRGMYRVGSCLL